MKHLIQRVLSIGIMFAFTGALNGQSIKSFDLSLNPKSLYYNSLELKISYRVNNNAISASYGTPLRSSMVNKMFKEYYFNPLQFEYLTMYSRIARVEYKRYLPLNKINSLFLAGGVNCFTTVFYGLVSPAKDEYGTVVGSFYHTSINAEIGYQLLVIKRFLLEVCAGLEPTRRNARIEAKSLNNQQDISSIKTYVKEEMKHLDSIMLNHYSVSVQDDLVIGTVFANFKMRTYFGFKIGIKINALELRHPNSGKS